MKNSAKEATYVCHNDLDHYNDIAVQGAGSLCPAKNIATFSTAAKKIQQQAKCDNDCDHYQGGGLLCPA